MTINLQGYEITLPDPPSDKTKIAGWDKKKSEQYFVRPYQLTDEEYDNLSPALQEEVQKTEIERRVMGYWFMNNGTPVWLTGDAYFYFTYFKFDGEFVRFNIHQAEDFYFYWYCENDKFCDGTDELKPRQEGCTGRKQSIYLNQGTLSFNCHYGIQSKSGDDAEKVNFDKLCMAFDSLPKWAKPELQGLSFPPHEELRFGRPRVTKKGEENKKYLNTVIDWKNTVFNAYDGKKLTKWIGDEGAKFPSTCKFDETWKVVRPALKKAKGKAYILSTMGEIDENAAEAYRQLWKDSNPAIRTKNGFTISGLYRYFIPNWRAYFHIEIDNVPVMDIYGYIDIPKVQQYIKNEYDSLKTEKEKFFFVRQNPANAEEALNYGSASNIFDTYRLTERLKELDNFEPSEQRPVKYLVGNLAWKDNVRFGDVVFNDNSNGKWKIAYLPNVAGQERVNRVFRQEGITRPFSDTPFRMGIDPFSYDNREGKGFSLGGFHMKLMSNVMHPELSNIYCCQYLFREKLADMFNEDVALTMFFYGARVNFERSPASGLLEAYMKKNKLMGFIMNRPDVTKKTAFTKRDNWAGTPATPDTIAMGIRYIENYIAEPNPLINENTTDNLKNFWFEESLKQLMDYTIENKTKFDLVASMQQTEIACQPDKRVKEAAKDQADIRSQIVKFVCNLPDKKSQIRQLV